MTRPGAIAHDLFVAGVTVSMGVLVLGFTLAGCLLMTGVALTASMLAAFVQSSWKEITNG